MREVKVISLGNDGFEIKQTIDKFDHLLPIKKETITVSHKSVSVDLTGKVEGMTVNLGGCESVLANQKSIADILALVYFIGFKDGERKKEKSDAGS